MRKTTRRLRPEERNGWNQFPSFFNGEQRSRARVEADAGNVEVIEFEVARAWFTNQCGPDCCPTYWLLETSEGDFVSIDSWDYLRPELPGESGPWTGGFFPGSRVQVDRWPLTGRVIVAEATGNPVPIERSVPQYLTELPGQHNQCLLYEESDLPVQLLDELRSSRLSRPDLELP